MMPLIYRYLYQRHWAEHREVSNRWLLWKCKYCPKRHQNKCEDYVKKE